MKFGSAFKHINKSIHKIGNRAQSTANKIGRKIEDEANEAHKLGRKASAIGIKVANGIKEADRYVQGAAPIIAAGLSAAGPMGMLAGQGVMGAAGALHSTSQGISKVRKIAAKSERVAQDADRAGRRRARVEFSDGADMRPDPRPAVLR